MSYGQPPGAYGQAPIDAIIEIPPEAAIVPVREPKPYVFPAFYS